MTEKDVSKKPTLMPAPKEPDNLPVENIGLIVPEGDDIAPGWTDWAATDNGFEPPEFIAVELEDGQRVQGILAESRYDACLWQQVKTTPGFAIAFTMDFKVDPSHDTDAECPEGMVVGVGIDPFGRTDPRSDGVQWALRDLSYSKVAKTSVTAIAQSELATVFVRSVAFVPGSTTSAWNGSGVVCRQTCVRTQYARTYLLLHPGASEGLWTKAAKAAHKNNWTIGGSADDAGLASSLLWPLTPTVRAVEPSQWNPPLTQQWFITHYPPGVNFIGMTEGELDQFL